MSESQNTTETIIEKMDWHRLLSRERYRETPRKDQRPVSSLRSDFEVDYDRVVFSTPFRSLQDKTQVIPLPDHDFVHTRLTHSLEVSCVGRSLGKMAGRELLLKYPELRTEGQYSEADFGSIVAAACLAHDIGNPPFGHAGEKAISEFFLNGPGRRYEERIANDKRWHDLIKFEGNANGFRILTNASPSVPGGIRLTYSTLGAFTKYPKESLPNYKSSGRTSEKKFGFFQSEREQFKAVAEALGLKRFRDDEHLNWCRHPLAYLVEAADDICYSIIDFEDGLRLGLIPWEAAFELLEPILGSDFDRSRLDRIPSLEEQAGYLRAVTINKLVHTLVQKFLDNEEALLKGEYDTSLSDDCEYTEALDAIKGISLKKVYRSRKVLEIEAAGFEVLSGLLDYFIRAVDQGAGQKKSYHSAKIRDLIPPKYQVSPEADLYHHIMAVCEYVSGMSDSYALSMYRTMKGTRLPGK